MVKSPFRIPKTCPEKQGAAWFGENLACCRSKLLSSQQSGSPTGNHRCYVAFWGFGKGEEAHCWPAGHSATIRAGGQWLEGQRLRSHLPAAPRLSSRDPSASSVLSSFLTAVLAAARHHAGHPHRAALPPESSP